MWELIKTGGWLMLPIILCSIVALAITIERFWVLRRNRIAPQNLVAQVWAWVKNNQLDGKKLKELHENSPLGRILAAGLVHAKQGRSLAKESMMDAATREIFDMNRYMNTLTVIANTAPLLGLLGTVVGMMDVFNVIVIKGNGNPALLAGGISKKLIATAGGLIVAIPTMYFHHFLSAKINDLILQMEMDSARLVELLFAEKEQEGEARK